MIGAGPPYPRDPERARLIIESIAWVVGHPLPKRRGPVLLQTEALRRSKLQELKP